MLCWFLLVLAAAFLALGSLTILRSPDWAPWKLAVLAGEYGYRLALLPLALAVGAWFGRGSCPVVSALTVVLGGLAAALLLRPCWSAARIARGLPAKLTEAFGPVSLHRAPFALGQLFRAPPVAVEAKTLTFADGLLLDFYPANRTTPGGAPAPCVVVVHGGGWDSGDRSQIRHFNDWLVGGGYAVAAISYRLAPKFRWPAQREDVLAALALLKSRSAELGIDRDRFVLLGRSAGGQIVEAVAYAAHDPAIRGVVALYAPADLHFAYAFSREDDILKSPQLLRQFLGGTPETASAAYDSASGYGQVRPGVPPTLLLHGQLDTLVWHRQSERLSARLAERKVPHAFVSLPWATHAFEYHLNGPGGQLTTYAIAWFMASVTR